MQADWQALGGLSDSLRPKERSMASERLFQTVSIVSAQYAATAWIEPSCGTCQNRHTELGGRLLDVRQFANCPNPTLTHDLFLSLTHTAKPSTGPNTNVARTLSYKPVGRHRRLCQRG
jgi:hypothetical protein